jgi:hypothetical protein
VSFTVSVVPGSRVAHRSPLDKFVRHFRLLYGRVTSSTEIYRKRVGVMKNKITATLCLLIFALGSNIAWTEESAAASLAKPKDSRCQKWVLKSSTSGNWVGAPSDRRWLCTKGEIKGATATARRTKAGDTRRSVTSMQINLPRNSTTRAASRAANRTAVGNTVVFDGDNQPARTVNESNTTVVNKGTINGGNLTGLTVNGSNNTVVNSGTITGTTGVRISGGSSSLVNSGTISATSTSNSSSSAVGVSQGN